MITNRKILGPMDKPDYQAINALAQSDLSWLLKSPRHFQMRAELRKETDAMRMGTFVHMAVLEPERFKNAYIVEPESIVIDGVLVELNRRVKKHRDWLDAFRIDNPGSLVVKPDQMENLTGMLKSILSTPALKELLSGGEAEVAATWSRDGRACKGLPDYKVQHSSHGRTLVDLKKTQDASVSGFSRSIYNFFYFGQAAWYLDGFDAEEFIFVAIEEKAPWPIGIYRADPSLIDYGRKTIDRLMNQLAECEAKNEWPGYASGKVENILLPAWVAGRDEESL